MEMSTKKLVVSHEVFQRTAKMYHVSDLSVVITVPGRDNLREGKFILVHGFSSHGREIWSRSSSHGRGSMWKVIHIMAEQGVE